MADPSSGLPDELVARVASGDREAFGELYRQFRPDIYRYAVHMCGSAVVAEDVVHDVFVAVIDAAGRYRPGRSGVRSWLLGIAHNHVRRWRHRRSFLPLRNDETDRGQAISTEADPHGALAREQLAAEVTRALAALPARDREVIVLCDLQEMTYEAAAAALGCAVGTIRSRLHRGRGRLARALDDLKSDVMYRTPAAKQL